MFTGIIECTGIVDEITPLLGGFEIVIRSPVSHELRVDQSVSHNGICLTVVEVSGSTHRVQVIAETVSRTEISAWKKNTEVNLERCLQANGRFDGHIVQGHVDSTGTVSRIDDHDGQLDVYIHHDPAAGITVSKGSVCLNGVSLTVVHSDHDQFSVSIIPYTRTHTNLGNLVPGDLVNIEFDIIGKYLQKISGSDAT